MSRIVRVGAAQMGGISRNEPKESVVEKLLGQMRRAHGEGCDIVVFPELTLTTYFARWLIEDEEELDRFCEADMPSPATRPLFDEAQRLGIGFHLGYAELAEENGVKRRFNSSVLVDKNGQVINRFRKMHLQRPPLGRELSGLGIEGRRNDLHRLQHADQTLLGT